MKNKAAQALMAQRETMHWEMDRMEKRDLATGMDDRSAILRTAQIVGMVLQLVDTLVTTVATDLEAREGASE